MRASRFDIVNEVKVVHILVNFSGIKTAATNAAVIGFFLRSHHARNAWHVLACYCGESLYLLLQSITYKTGTQFYDFNFLEYIDMKHLIAKVITYSKCALSFH